AVRASGPRSARSPTCGGTPRVKQVIQVLKRNDREIRRMPEPVQQPERPLPSGHAVRPARLAKPPESGRSARLDPPLPIRDRTAVSLIPSLIHVRVPTFITVSHRTLGRLNRPSWSALDSHPSS